MFIHVCLLYTTNVYASVFVMLNASTFYASHDTIIAHISLHVEVLDTNLTWARTFGAAYNLDFVSK